MAVRNQRCETCSYWSAISGSYYGQCRRRAPQAIIVPASDQEDRAICWPDTNAEEFCGDWQCGANGNG